MRACAKVNLCLSVKFPPRNGYHELESVFQTLDLHDTLEVVACPCDASANTVTTQLGTPVALVCEVSGLPVRDNLVFRALDAAERAYGVPPVFPGQMLRISVEKRIPAGGGLGGGSSDAAAMLKAYSQLVNVNPRGDKMLEAARSIGSDVAFFLYGGAALMEGRGDRLCRCLPSFPLPVVLMGDAQGNSTPEVYAAFDEEPGPEPDARALAEALERGASPEALASLCQNNLGSAACRVAPRLAERVERASADPDVLAALVTGSGATCYAVCADEGAASRFVRRAAAWCDWVQVAHASEG